MDAQSILAAKVAYLSGNSQQDIDEAMKAFIDNNPSLKTEIAFVEAFWHEDNDMPEEQPSTALDASFYQMLSQAQSAQTQAQQLVMSEQKPSFWQQLGDFLTPKPMMQFAMLAGVFGLGYFVNTPQQSMPENTAMTGLQQEVQSLSSLVALSMIENQSASKRLTGISYSKQSAANDEALDSALLKMINNDKSTAVRLAAIDALAERGFGVDTELSLAEGVHGQKLMVQISLIKLLTDHGSTVSKIKLKDMVSNNLLHLEAEEFFEAQLQAKQSLQSI